MDDLMEGKSAPPSCVWMRLTNVAQLLHCTVVEQMDMLQLMWDSSATTIPSPSESPSTLAQAGLKQR
jgi:predicted nuclease of predicted toxin-antitoxin system